MVTGALIKLIVVTVVLTIAQVWLSRKKCWWQGIILPIIYWILAIPYIYEAFLTTGPIRRIPDYYQAATFFFPGAWFFMIYFIFYYYNQCKEGKPK